MTCPRALAIRRQISMVRMHGLHDLHVEAALFTSLRTCLSHPWLFFTCTKLSPRKPAAWFREFPTYHTIIFCYYPTRACELSALELPCPALSQLLFCCTYSQLPFLFDSPSARRFWVSWSIRPAHLFGKKEIEHEKTCIIIIRQLTT
jgi:hypothetical protein